MISIRAFIRGGVMGWALAALWRVMEAFGLPHIANDQILAVTYLAAILFFVLTVCLLWWADTRSINDAIRRANSRSED